MKTTHTFSIVEENEIPSDSIFPEVDMKICSGAGLSDMLYAFERFLQATGYVLPDNSYLDFVVDEPLPTSYKEEFSESGTFGDFNGDSFNQKNYKGEF